MLKVDNPQARAFYEIEALREAWSARELERQIASLLFERLAKSRDKEKLLALAKKGHEVTVPRDVIKDPFVLEFLDLPERHTWLERGDLFTLLDTDNERPHVRGSDFAQCRQIDLGVDSSSRYGHVSQVITHLLQCQTLGEKVRGTSMTQNVRAVSLKLQAQPLL